MDFLDKKFDAGAPAHFKDLFFSTGKIPTGSVTEYYEEVSSGLVSLTGEVFGPFKLNHKVSYYANGGYGRQLQTPNSTTLADDALTVAMPSINFDPYDNDGNGYVSLVHYDSTIPASVLIDDRRSMVLSLFTLVGVQNNPEIPMISGVSSGIFRGNAKWIVCLLHTSRRVLLYSSSFISDVKVFAFLTIPQDVKIGISAHELGHLRR